GFGCGSRFGIGFGLRFGFGFRFGSAFALAFTLGFAFGVGRRFDLLGAVAGRRLRVFAFAGILAGVVGHIKAAALELHGWRGEQLLDWSTAFGTGLDPRIGELLVDFFKAMM